MGLGLSLPFAMDALDQLVARRRQERLQDEAIREQIRQFNVNAQERSRAHDLQLRQQDLNEALRRDTLGANEQHRQDLRAQNYVTGMTPPTPDVGEQMAGQIRSIGLGGALRTGPAKVLGGESQGLNTFPPPETAPPTFVRGAEALPEGGFGYQAARQAAEERAAAQSERVQAQRDVAADRLKSQESQNAILNEIRRGNQDIQRGNLAVAQGGLAIRQDLATEKKDAAAKQAQQAEDSIRANANEGLRAVNDLLDPNGKLSSGAQYLYGWSSYLPVPPGAAGNAQAARDQLVSRLTLEELTKLRQASKTGGALGNVSDRDVTLLSNAASRLKGRLTEEQAAVELQHIRNVLNKITGGATTGGGSPQRVYYDMNGNPVQR